MKALMLLLLAALPEAGATVPGTLCISSTAAPVCQPTKAGVASVAKAATARTFVWRRANDAEIAIGEIPPDVTEVTWPARTVHFPIRDEGPAATRRDLALTAASANRQWQFTLTAREASALRRLALPDDAVTVTAVAAHRRTARVRISRDRLTQELVLVPLPTIGGRVLDENTRKGITGAMVTALPDETAVAVTDYNGNFHFEVAGEWPAALRISAATYGVRLLPVPPSQTSVSLAWTELTPAGGLALTIEHDDDLAVELWQMREDEESIEIASKVLRRDETVARFEGLERGEYEVRLSGRGPFERYVTTATVKENEVRTEEIALKPVPLELILKDDGNPVPDAKIVLNHMNPQWQTSVTANEQGRVSGPLWQQGLVVAFVTRPGVGGAHIEQTSLSGTERIEWTITLQGGVISGSVIDAVEKFPVRQANVRLQTNSQGTSREVMAVTDDKGEFQFTSVPAGTQTITSHVVGYRPARETFDLSAETPDRRLRLELKPAQGLPVRVSSSYGAPLVGATITDGSGAPYGEWVTDAEGRAEVPVQRGETATVFVLPREGSLAVATLTVPQDASAGQEQQIIVPKGEVTIDIRTQDETGQAVPEVEFVLRHNDVVIPEAVARHMFKLHGNLLRTNRTGGAQLRNLPTGSYEFWPYFSVAEYQQLRRGPVSPGTALIATPGTNSVVLTFERRK